MAPSGAYRPGSHSLEGDWSSAAYLLAAGAIGPSPVLVGKLKRDSRQGDRAILDILQKMGARVSWEGSGVLAAPKPLQGVDLDMSYYPDLVPTVLAVAAHAESASRIRNIAHLGFKESNRINALAVELRKTGCVVRVLPDGMVLTPPPGGPRQPAEGVVFSSHGDHRLAMSLVLLGLRSGFEVKLDDYACVNKSFPGFWEVWEKIKK
jgi:3-phosphoshikimate 1-carboxyvinyltransferase